MKSVSEGQGHTGEHISLLGSSPIEFSRLIIVEESRLEPGRLEMADVVSFPDLQISVTVLTPLNTRKKDVMKLSQKISFTVDVEEGCSHGHECNNRGN